MLSQSITRTSPTSGLDVLVFLRNLETAKLYYLGIPSDFLMRHMPTS